MQNEATLTELGFQKNGYGVWFYRVSGKVLTAKVVANNGPIPYVVLFEALPQIDRRPLSDHKGRRLLSRIKDCCTHGSVERVISKYSHAGCH